MESKIRVLELLKELAYELKKVHKEISESNSNLQGVLDQVIMNVKALERQIAKGKTPVSFSAFGDLLKVISYLIDIISKWTDTLSYKLGRFYATLNKLIEDEMSVGKNIKLFRINAGLKQKDLAAKIGVEDSYLSSVENSKKEPSLILLRKIAATLNIPISMFFWENIETLEDKTPEAKLKQLLLELAKTTTSHEKPKKHRN